MREAIILRREHGAGYALSIAFPYDQDLLAEFQELVPDRARWWHNPTWLFRRAYLDAIRAFAVSACERRGWRLIDTIAMKKKQATATLAEVAQTEYEEHIEGMLEVLPRLPAKALRLAGWLPDAIVLDLEMYINDKALFLAVVRAGLPDRRQPPVGYISLASHAKRLLVANDPRIVTALLQREILSFQPLSLEPSVVFEDGIAHFQGRQEELWFGAPYTEALKKEICFFRPGEVYTVTLVGQQVYLVAQARAILHHRLGWRLPILSFLRFYHLEAWFRLQAESDLREEACTARVATRKWLWSNTYYWEHPADALLQYLANAGDPLLQAFLELSDEALALHQDRIRQLKEEHAHRDLQYCRDHASELATPLLERKHNDELREMAAKEQIPVKVSWKKARLVQALLSAGAASERIAFRLLELDPVGT